MRGLIAVIGLYALYAIVGVAVHPQFIYPFDQTPHWMPALVPHEIAAESGSVHVVEADQDGPTVLFFMGNTGALARHPSALKMHVDAGRHLIAMEYPGGGGLPGHPTETILKAKALEAYDWAVAQAEGPVIVHGYSMGSALALHVAQNRPVQTLLMDAPFARICEQMTRISALPACWLPGVQKWDSLAALDGVTANIQIVQGSEDDLVLPSDSARLAAAMEEKGLSVARIVLDGVGHNDMFRHDGYASQIAAFIDTEPQ